MPARLLPHWSPQHWSPQHGRHWRCPKPGAGNAPDKASGSDSVTSPATTTQSPEQPVNPATVVQVVREGFRGHTGHRLLTFGAHATGKNTFWEFLEADRTWVRVERTLTPTGVGHSNKGPFQRLRTITDGPDLDSAVRSYSVPGAPQYRHVWPQVLKAARPEVLVYLIDHDAGRGEVPGAGFTPARMAEHAEALTDLQAALFAYPEVAADIRSVVVLGNKQDAWGERVDFDTLLRQAYVYPMLSRMSTVLCGANTRFECCSARTGAYVAASLHAITQELSAAR